MPDVETNDTTLEGTSGADLKGLLPEEPAAVDEHEHPVEGLDEEDEEEAKYFGEA